MNVMCILLFILISPQKIDLGEPKYPVDMPSVLRREGQENTDIDSNYNRKDCEVSGLSFSLT